MNCTKCGNDQPPPIAAPGVSNDLAGELLALHEEYAAAVNTAIAEGRHELIDLLADEFSDVALELMTRPDRAA